MPRSLADWITATPGAAIADNGVDLYLVDTTAAAVTITLDSANFPAQSAITFKHARSTDVSKACTIALSGGAQFNGGTATSFVIPKGRSAIVVRAYNDNETALVWEYMYENDRFPPGWLTRSSSAEGGVPATLLPCDGTRTILGNLNALSTFNTGLLNQSVAWNSIWSSVTSFTVATPIGSALHLGPLFDTTGYELIQLSFSISGYAVITGGSVAIGLRLTDNATSTIFINTTFSSASLPASTYFFHELSTDYLTRTTVAQDAALDWRIQLMAVGLTGVETMTLSGLQIGIALNAFKLPVI